MAYPRSGHRRRTVRPPDVGNPLVKRASPASGTPRASLRADVGAERRSRATGMVTARRTPAVLLGVLLLAACGRSADMEGGPGAGGVAADSTEVAGQRARSPGAMLAYEHDVGITLADAEVLTRAGDVRAACTAARFGACTVLGAWEQGGAQRSASLRMRIVPEGVEPLVALASAGGDIGSRNTRAEDLAVAVRDNAVAQDRLRRELQRLGEFQARSDLSVADMIALSERIATAEAEQERVEQESAQQRRRIDTELLTIRFQPPHGQRGRGEIGRAVREFGATLATGTAWTIRAAAFLIPLLIVVGLCTFAVRRLRRRRRSV